MAAANAAEQCDSSFQESPRLLKRTVDLSVQFSEVVGTYFFCFSGFDTKLGKVMVRRWRWALNFSSQRLSANISFVLVFWFRNIRKFGARLCGICGKVIMRCSRDCFFNEKMNPKIACRIDLQDGRLQDEVDRAVRKYFLCFGVPVSIYT